MMSQNKTQSDDTDDVQGRDDPSPVIIETVALSNDSMGHAITLYMWRLFNPRLKHCCNMHPQRSWP